MYDWAIALLGTLVSPYLVLAATIVFFGREKLIHFNKDETGHFRPTVSVWIPTLNEELLIARKLDNLMEQTYPLIEVLIYDSSIDNTRRIVEEYSRKYPQIRLVPQAERIGAARTFNQALVQAQGEIIIKTDADTNLKSPSAIQDLVSNFEDPSIGGVAAIYTKSSGPEKYFRSFMTKVQLLESNLDSTIIAHPGLLALRKKSVTSVEADSMAEDTEEFILIRKKGYRTIIDNRVHTEEEVPASFSLRRKQRDRRAQGILRAIFKHRDVFLNPKFGKYGMVVFPLELFIIAASPFLLLIISGVVGYLLFLLNPLLVLSLVILVVALTAASKAFFSALDTQLSGFIAMIKVLSRKREPLWARVR